MTDNSNAYTWRPLAVLSLYRMIIVVSLGLLFLGTRGTPMMSTAQPVLFLMILVPYFGLSVFAYLLVRVRWPVFRAQAYSQALLDIIAIAGLIYAGGTLGNGLGPLMIVAIAGSSLLMSTRMAVLMGAIATLLLLGQQVMAHLETGIVSVGYTQVGFLGFTAMVTAATGSLLARRARENQALADQRAEDLIGLERLNQLIVQRLEAGVLALDQYDRVRLANDATDVLLGSDITPGTPLAELSEPLATALREWRQRPDADPVPVVLHVGDPEVAPRFRSLGPHGTVIFIHDSSRLKAQVQNAKLASLGRLTANIAHEIRNPLGAIQHAAQLLQEAPELAPASTRLVEIIRNQGGRLNRVVENVLQLSRRQAPTRQRINLSEWLPQFVAEFRQQQPDSAYDLDVAVAPGTPAVRFDPDHLHQVLSNLCANALRHGRTEGEPLCIALEASRDNRGEASLDVRDNGPGIAPEAAIHLFEPFFTTASSGTGLGLFLCRELCENNEARLTYRAGEQGAAFRISFTGTALEI